MKKENALVVDSDPTPRLNHLQREFEGIRKNFRIIGGADGSSEFQR